MKLVHNQHLKTWLDILNNFQVRLCLDALPAITMSDTNPIFYKITMMGELLTAVLRGTYPVT